ncbi:transport protein [Ceratobasidium sp. AG-Ba]|nr:transport protein [Ceratobasidium sp. AG-Ba]
MEGFALNSNLQYTIALTVFLIAYIVFGDPSNYCLNGLFPGLVYFFTFWYRQEERSLIVALVVASSTLAGVFGGVIAYGVGYEPSRGSGSVEMVVHPRGQVTPLSCGSIRLTSLVSVGIPSILNSVLVWFYFPDFPETATWLTSDERDRTVARLEGVASIQYAKDLRSAKPSPTLLAFV